MAKYYKYGDAQYRASQKYKNENIRRIVLSLNKRIDEDIINHLDHKENIQGYLKEIIRKDMNNE